MPNCTSPVVAASVFVRQHEHPLPVALAHVESDFRQVEVRMLNPLLDDVGLAVAVGAEQDGRPGRQVHLERPDWNSRSFGLSLIRLSGWYDAMASSSQYAPHRPPLSATNFTPGV